MRAKIEELPIDEIYADYRLLKELEEKYYYCGNSSIKDAAIELNNILKREIVNRELKACEIRFCSDSISSPHNVMNNTLKS